jgi:hypothetical protein
MQVRNVLTYAARLALCLLLTELLTHSIYANAFARFHLWARIPAEVSVRTFGGGTMAAFAFFKLLFLWLKFVVIWRVARLFALVDGLDPPENMTRCEPCSRSCGCLSLDQTLCSLTHNLAHLFAQLEAQVACTGRESSSGCHMCRVHLCSCVCAAASM